MFGYIRPDSKELKVKEYDLYKSTYCGLCRVMGKRYSYLYKMSLSYDFVFMALLRLYVSSENVTFSKKSCLAHPTKKRVIMDKNKALELSSDVGVVMLYHSLVDKINDDGFFKSLPYRCILPEMKGLKKKACKQTYIQDFDNIAKERLEKLSEIEKANTPSVDMPAEEFGIILGEALSTGYTEDTKRIVFELGKSLGKWIYIIDAVDDIDKDEKSGSYNPLIATFSSSKEAKEHGEMLNVALLNILSDADSALSLLDNTDDGLYNILSNVLRLGNTETQEKLLIKNGFLSPKKTDKEQDQK